MYRILIADDEGLMVESLKNMALKAFPDQLEVETARSGRAAIELAEYFHPDIIYMDIQMPGINGIEALREIRRFNQTAQCYVISAYDKFDYAQEAISLGVEKYLTKPVNRSTFLSVTEEAMHRVDSMRQRRSDQLKVQEKLETIIPVVENGLVGMVMMPGEMQDFQYYKELLDITEENGFVTVYWFGSEIRDGKLYSPVGIGIQNQEFQNQFRAIVKSFRKCMIGSALSDRIVVITPCEQEKLEYEERIRVIEETRRIASRLEEKLGLKFRAGIGRVHKIDDQRLSYQEALQALQESDSRVIHTNDLVTKGFFEGDFPEETERQIFACIHRGDVNGMRIQADLFFDWMVRRYPDSRDNIRLKVLEYVIAAEKEAFRAGTMNYGFELRSSYLTEVCAFEGYELLRSWMMEKLTAVCLSIRNKREEQSETVVSKAKAYIKENFSRDISLDDVSREVNVSPYYFSKLFKEEEGQNFIEYLTKIRVDRAKQLLCEETLSIKEISIMVGYADPNYFSRIFRKQMDMSPREYRESMTGSAEKARG